MIKRIVMSGAGGQGVITASIILAEAAVLYENLNAVQTQSYGPEARGGATRSDVIISDEPVYYPKVINPHFLVCLTEEAYNTYSNIVRPGGILLTDSSLVKSERKVDAHQIKLNLYKSTINEIGEPIVFNICMLGAMIELTHVVAPESLLKIFKDRLPEKFLALNQKAFDLGMKLARML